MPSSPSPDVPEWIKQKLAEIEASEELARINRRPPPSGKVRSDSQRVKRLLSDQLEREARLRAWRERDTQALYNSERARHYHNGPAANPGWCCQGGLPSLGEGYS